MTISLNPSPAEEKDKINVWLAVAVVVLLILLTAVLIAPYVRVSWSGDEDKFATAVDELKDVIQSNPSGGISAEQLKEILQSVACEMQKAAGEPQQPKTGDLEKVVEATGELTHAVKSNRLNAQQLGNELRPLLLEICGPRQGAAATTDDVPPQETGTSQNQKGER